MRDLLFRGKSANTGEWIYGRNILRFHGTEEFADEVFIGPIGNFVLVRKDESGNIDGMKHAGFVRVDMDTVGQYTGLNDKNGKRIFEGDIVKVHWGLDFCDDSVHAVTWQNAAWYIVEKGTHAADLLIDVDKSILEVIGNIYENPELMEETP